jgi:hypothetical protein
MTYHFTYMPGKRMFTPQDDQELRHLVRTYGDDNWILISTQMSRAFTTRQCRDRWRNYLNPEIARAQWTTDNDATLLDAYHRMGNRWSSLAALFPGRTSNFIRNRCQALIRKINKREKDGRLRMPVQPHLNDWREFQMTLPQKVKTQQEEIIDLFLGRGIKRHSERGKED